MKTAYELAKEELKDFTDYPTGSKIVQLMLKYAELLVNEYSNWLWEMDRLKLTNQLPPFETPEAITEYFLKAKIERLNFILEEKGRIKTEFGDIMLVGAKHKKIKGTKLYIGVISKNADDFLDWKRENNLKGKHQSPKLFRTKDNRTYVCFANVCDTKSWSIDVLLETSLAKSNENYEQIKSVASQQLSST